MSRERDRFRDRGDAGRQLGERLSTYRHAPDTVVLGLPRGGVPVAAEIAKTLDLPLDVLIVRKLGVPGYEEVAFGAIASGGTTVLNTDVIRSAGVDHATIERVTADQTLVLRRRETIYRGDRPPLEVADRTVIVVDDGTATGATMRVAVDALRSAQPARIVVAVGVAPPDTVRRLRSTADEVVAILTPRNFMAVGAWYDDFAQTTDEEVVALLTGGG